MPEQSLLRLWGRTRALCQQLREAGSYLEWNCRDSPARSRLWRRWTARVWRMVGWRTGSLTGRCWSAWPSWTPVGAQVWTRRCSDFRRFLPELLTSNKQHHRWYSLLLLYYNISQPSIKETPLCSCNIFSTLFESTKATLYRLSVFFP